MIAGPIVHRVGEIQAEFSAGEFKWRLGTRWGHKIRAYNHQIPLDK